MRTGSWKLWKSKAKLYRIILYNIFILTKRGPHVYHTFICMDTISPDNTVCRKKRDLKTTLRSGQIFIFISHPPGKSNNAVNPTIGALSQKRGSHDSAFDSLQRMLEITIVCNLCVSADVVSELSLTPFPRAVDTNRSTRKQTPSSSEPPKV